MRIGLVLHLTGQAPPLDRLAAHVRERLDELPSLSLSIVGRGTTAVWHQQPPDLEHHLSALELPAGTDIHHTLRELHEGAFTDGRPPWTMTLLHGHTPGQYVIVFRISHGLQDVGGMTRTLETLFAAPPVEPASSSAAVQSLTMPPRPSLRHRAYAAVLLARSSIKSPLWPHPDHGHSTERALQWTMVSTKLLRDLAGPYGGSANDAFLATLVRATSRWATQHHPRYDGSSLTVTVAINNRRSEAVDNPGNRVAAGRFRLPGHKEPLGQGLRTTVAATGPLKQPSYREAIRRLSENIPPSIVDRSFRLLLSPERAAVTSSHFVIRHPLALNGDPVHAIDPITVLPLGAPVSALMITYQGISRVVFVTDPVLPGADQLHQIWLNETTAFQVETAVKEQP
ncbi:wax ester/triacylglycerol synthase domain-containing protein [Streptomyces sp. NPDC056257]|uniref:wax ester/triacylglycerol synthase domain-containing protein n=1 Tax=Streptomyces sp. NPDC056257 TaxID=3345765 RepID=UPI0035E0C5EA